MVGRTLNFQNIFDHFIMGCKIRSNFDAKIFFSSGLVLVTSDRNYKIKIMKFLLLNSNFIANLQGVPFITLPISHCCPTARSILVRFFVIYLFEIFHILNLKKEHQRFIRLFKSLKNKKKKLNFRFATTKIQSFEVIWIIKSFLYFEQNNHVPLYKTFSVDHYQH